MPGKIIVQILLEDISKHTEEREDVRDRPQGFTKGKSCPTNLVAFYGRVIASVDKGRATDIYINVCKTFDMIPYNNLSTKLERYEFDR